MKWKKQGTARFLTALGMTGLEGLGKGIVARA